MPLRIMLALEWTNISGHCLKEALCLPLQLTQQKVLVHPPAKCPAVPQREQRAALARHRDVVCPTA